MNLLAILEMTFDKDGLTKSKTLWVSNYLLPLWQLLELHLKYQAAEYEVKSSLSSKGQLLQHHGPTRRTWTPFKVLLGMFWVFMQISQGSTCQNPLALLGPHCCCVLKLHLGKWSAQTCQNSWYTLAVEHWDHWGILRVDLVGVA